MFIGFFDFCQELMSGYKIWLIFTVILSVVAEYHVHRI